MYWFGTERTLHHPRRLRRYSCLLASDRLNSVEEIHTEKGEIYHLQFHYSNGCNGQKWAYLKQRTRNLFQAPYKMQDPKDLVHLLFLEPHTGSWTGILSAETWISFYIGYQGHRQNPNPLCCRTGPTINPFWPHFLQYLGEVKQLLLHILLSDIISLFCMCVMFSSRCQFGKYPHSDTCRKYATHQKL